MTKIVLYMSMSLDGFIAGAADGPGNPLGTDGMRLFSWMSEFDSGRPAIGPSAPVWEEMHTAGSVITGRRTAEIGQYWGGDHHDGVQIFLLSRSVPAKNPWSNIHYVTDGIESCVAQAKAAAGDKHVLLHGAYTARQALRAGLLDEIEVAVIPVLLGTGRPLFSELSQYHELELIRNLQAPAATHLRYRVHYAATAG
ncbi:MAG TPA: dihydrofolate reductase family protein [Streptosporangiaceae bacterium]|nr:dihydrofolate reductase family protein [Streptosporangiaceae bacterium]